MAGFGARRAGVSSFGSLLSGSSPSATWLVGRGGRFCLRWSVFHRGAWRIHHVNLILPGFVTDRQISSVEYPDLSDLTHGLSPSRAASTAGFPQLNICLPHIETRPNQPPKTARGSAPPARGHLANTHVETTPLIAGVAVQAPAATATPHPPQQTRHASGRRMLDQDRAVEGSPVAGPARSRTALAAKGFLVHLTPPPLTNTQPSNSAALGPDPENTRGNWDRALRRLQRVTVDDGRPLRHQRARAPSRLAPRRVPFPVPAFAGAAYLQNGRPSGRSGRSVQKGLNRTWTTRQVSGPVLGA